MPKIRCESCDGVKDSRAKSCQACRFKYSHPRKGTAKKGTELKGSYRFVKTDNGTKYEHRLIMEAHLGRQLEQWEHVHHIDGNGFNNDISNLEILDCKEHGRRHMDSKTAKERSKLAHEAKRRYRNGN